MKRTLLAVAAAALALGCGGSAPMKKGSAVQSSALRNEVQTALNDLGRGLKLEVWATFTAAFSAEAAEGLGKARSRVEARWKLEQILDIKLTVVNVSKSGDVYTAAVRWEKSVIDRMKQMRRDEGRSEILLKREDERLKVLVVGGDPLY